MPAPGDFLAALSQAFQGYSHDRGERLKETERQRALGMQTASAARAAELHGVQLDNIRSEIAARNAKPAVPVVQPHYDAARGGHVFQDGTFRPVAGLPPKPADAAPQTPWVAKGFESSPKGRADYLAFLRQESGATRAPEKADKPDAPARATEGQIAAGMFATRMESAETLLQQHEAKGRPTRGLALAAGVPFVGDALRNTVSSDVQQMYRQAQEDWVRAKLRKESGAAIGDDEMEREIKTYFPQPGDGQPVTTQKAARRAEATKLLRQSAGSGAALYAAPGAPGKPVTTDPILDKYGLTPKPRR